MVGPIAIDAVSPNRSIQLALLQLGQVLRIDASFLLPLHLPFIHPSESAMLQVRHSPAETRKTTSEGHEWLAPVFTKRSMTDRARHCPQRRDWVSCRSSPIRHFRRVARRVRD